MKYTTSTATTAANTITPMIIPIIFDHKADLEALRASSWLLAEFTCVFVCVCVCVFSEVRGHFVHCQHYTIVEPSIMCKIKILGNIQSVA